MLDIDTAALTNPDALRYARNVVRDVDSGISLEASLTRRAVPDSLIGPVTLITEAHTAGWFPLPAGRGLSYSRTQFGTLRQHSANAPWWRTLITSAERFEQRRSRLQPRDRSFGVVALPNWLAEARNAHQRLSRLPLEHVTGGITVALWLQALRDTQLTALRIEREMECLTPEWMWDPSHSLTEQIDRLRAMDCTYLLRAYVSTTRNRRLDAFERKLLADVQHRGLPPAAYEQALRDDHHRRLAEAEASWRLNYELIHKLASILENVTTYNQGALTRQLRAKSNGAFRILRNGLDGDLSIELRHQYEVGGGQRLCSTFMLVNYCLALSDAIEGQPPTFTGYLHACEAAGAQVRSIYEEDLRTAG